MAITTNTQVERSLALARLRSLGRSPSRSPRHRPSGPRRRPGAGSGAGRRPPRLVSAPRRARPVVCGQWRRPLREIGWLLLIGSLVFMITFGLGWLGGAPAHGPGSPAVSPVVSVDEVAPSAG